MDRAQMGALLLVCSVLMLASGSWAWSAPAPIGDDYGAAHGWRPGAAGLPDSGSPSGVALPTWRRSGIESNAPRALSASRIRAAVLFRGGEFSTFRHLPSSLRRYIETVKNSPPLDRQVDDEWIAIDKAQHLVVSFFWTLGTQYVAVNKGGLSEYRALPVSVTSSAAIGVTKEYYDLRLGPGRFFSVRDLVADAVGILLATGVILL